MALLKKLTYRWGSAKSVLESLYSFHLGELNSVYKELLLRILEQVRANISKILRILEFAKRSLSLDKLSYTLAIDNKDITPLNFKDKIS